ncbi:MAG: hypothetical protein LBQ60_13510 [Bacteroidales bacterium]|jgi:dUTPase|nr:hypothetical protein [Bacteroidales bacterium]
MNIAYTYRRHKNLINTIFVLLFAAAVGYGCSKETKYADDDKTANVSVTLELFTRATGYGEPVTRTGYADEDGIGRTPWVLVFSGNTNSAVFVEAVQAFENPATSKIYVVLQPQASDCQLLILANTPSAFYINGITNYPFDADNLNTQLKEKTLSQVCAMLLTAPLSASETNIPYTGQRIPMSINVPVSGIDNNLILGILNLNRAVARMFVTNSASNFTLLGINYIGNISRQGRLHQLSGEPLMDNSSILGVYYDPANDIAAANPSEDNSMQGTWANPLYVYEALTAYGIFVIIRGEYEGVTYYYKAAILDGSGSAIQINRHTHYNFTITSVTGPGFTSLANALASKSPSNTVNYTLTVVDLNSHEIIANGEYFMAVTNSHYVIHTPEGTDEEYVAFTITNNCTHDFPNDNLISVASGTGLEITSTPKMQISPNSSTVVTDDVTIKMSTGFTNGTISIILGNLSKAVTIERRERIVSTGTVVSDFASSLTPGGKYTSAYVADPANTSWLQLSPFSDRVLESYEDIYVDSGDIFLHVGANGTGSVRKNGIVYVNTAADVASLKRIKFEVEQE